MRRTTTAILLAFACAVGGCGTLRDLSGVRASNTDLADNGSLVGTLHASATLVHPVIATFRDERDGDVLQVRTTATDAGIYAVRVPRGARYRVVAFDDRNRNGLRDPDEPWGASALSDRVSGDGVAADRVTLPELALDRRDPLPGFASRALERASVTTATSDVAPSLGEIVTLDDPRLTQASGRKGLWAPSTFLRRVGVGMLFLSPHDPRRTPVVFVAGAGGGPVQWRAMIAALDRTRFEPWLFLYPSGLRLEESSRALEGTLGYLKDTLGVTRIDIVAYSMGGLVAREFLRENTRAGSPIEVKTFIALATPWNGHAAASLGLRLAPAAIPVWIDLVPDSPFLKALLDGPLDRRTDFRLFYGRSAAPGATSDGTIAYASLLDARARAQATEVRAFDVNHDTIIRSADVIAACSAALGAPSSKASASATASLAIPSTPGEPHVQ